MTETERIAYNMVRSGSARTRAELSKMMGVSRPTASTVADSLISCGLLREGGKWHSTGGRTPTLLMACPDAFSLIGAEIVSGSMMEGVLINAEGRVLRSCEMPVKLNSVLHTLDAVSRLWRQLDPALSASGIGIALPRDFEHLAPFAAPDGTPPTLGEFRKSLHRQFVGKFVHAAPHLALAAASENFGGAADQAENFMLLSLEKNVEAVFYINGRYFAGSHGAAGELRDLPTVIPGDGGGATTLGEALSERFPDPGKAGPELLSAICAGGLRHVLSILDIDVIVMSGRFLDFDDGFVPLLERKLADFRCSIKLAAFGRFSAARGAALETHIGV